MNGGHPISTRRSGVIVVLGGATFLVVSLLISVLLALIDEAFFERAYRSDGTVLLVWFGHKIVYAAAVAICLIFVEAALPVRSWFQGVVAALISWVVVVSVFLGMSSVVVLPGSVWLWWALYSLLVTVPSGAAMGIVSHRYLLRTGR